MTSKPHIEEHKLVPRVQLGKLLQNGKKTGMFSDKTDHIHSLTGQKNQASNWLNRCLRNVSLNDIFVATKTPSPCAERTLKPLTVDRRKNYGMCMDASIRVKGQKQVEHCLLLQVAQLQV